MTVALNTNTDKQVLAEEKYGLAEIILLVLSILLSLQRRNTNIDNY